MNPDPDYSAAYLQLTTSEEDLSGDSFVFTSGRGNDIQAAAVAAVAERLVGRSLDGLLEEPAEVVGLVDWTYLTEFLDPGRAREILEERRGGRNARIDELRRRGIAAYTTSPGWLGYPDEKLARLCREAVASGFDTIKLKVGADTERDRRRMAIAREAAGPDTALAVDANQLWSVPEAIAVIRRLADFGLRWVEEPTHPDDIVGHATIAKAVHPVPIATGECLANTTLAKQFLQLGGVQVLQIDATRMGGVHDLVAMVLMAAHAGVDVIPHAGGVGLCEAVQHFAFFNAVSVAPGLQRLAIEYVEHLHEHLADPVEVSQGRYRLPTRPGASTAFRPETAATFAYPTGTAWQT